MVVIDRSGSMSGPGGSGMTKLQQAQHAASLFVQLIRTGAGDTTGVESFSTSATNPPDALPAKVDAAAKQNLVGNQPYTGGVIGAIGPGGNTSIGAGLRVAKQAFPSPHGGSRRAVLLLTDGLQNTKPLRPGHGSADPRLGMNRAPDRLYLPVVVVLCSRRLWARGERRCVLPFRIWRSSAGNGPYADCSGRISSLTGDRQLRFP
jgi:VWA domain-containing protein